jgi:hypothetical protein
MKTVERIAMKCTRAEYESIKCFVGKLTGTNKKDFIAYTYLLNDYEDNSCCMDEVIHSDMKSRKIYETFDKNIFLKACGIDTEEIKLNCIETELTREEIEAILGYKIKIVK